MTRPSDAALGPPEAIASGPDTQMLTTGFASTDLLAKPQAMAKASEAAAKATAEDANLPVIMAGVDYWFMPTAPDPHAYGAMLEVSLPWLNFARGNEVDAARRRAVADNSELAAAADARAVITANSMLLDARMRQADLRAEVALASIEVQRIVGNVGVPGDVGNGEVSDDH